MLLLLLTHSPQRIACFFISLEGLPPPKSGHWLENDDQPRLCMHAHSVNWGRKLASSQPSSTINEAM